MNTDQKIFLTLCYKQNNEINGAEVRRKFKEQFPGQPNLYGKKVQNML